MIQITSLQLLYRGLVSKELLKDKGGSVQNHKYVYLIVNFDFLKKCVTEKLYVIIENNVYVNFTKKITKKISPRK